EAADDLDRSCEPLDRLLPLVEPSGGIPVLDRPSDRTRLGDALDRTRDARRVRGVAVLEINGDRKVGGVRELLDVCHDVVERGLPVESSEREREAGARRGQRLEPERLENA